jgi:hypothetical protein
MLRSVGIRILCTLGLALSLCQCEKVSVPGQASKAETSPYDVTLKLTPEAVKRLSGLKDTVLIVGYYYGMPTKAAMPRANKIHQIELGSDRYSFAPTTVTAHMPGLHIDRTRFGDIIDQTPYVFISASSAGAAGNSDELLDCTYFRGTLARARSGPVEISCSLLPPLEGEDRVIP